MSSSENYKKILRLFHHVREHYWQRGDVVWATIHQGKDIHLFLQPESDPSKVIHVQGYPEYKSEHGMKIYARIIDYERVMEISAAEEVSEEVSLEDVLLIQNHPFDASALIKKLSENCNLLTDTPQHL